MTDRSPTSRQPTLKARFMAWAEAVELSPAERMEKRLEVLERRVEALEGAAEDKTS